MTLTRRTLLGSAAAASALGYPANEAVHVGVIGTGGRARVLMRSLAQLPGVKIVAVCDIWDHHLKLGGELAGAKAFTTKEHEALLGRKDVDAVVIGTPDHWHTPMTIAACDAGKDVYVEKPLTHDLKEGRAVIEARNRSRRIVQVGMQQRSMPHVEKAREIVQSGRLGRIHKVRLTWNRNNRGRTARAAPAIDPRTVDWQRFLGSARPQPFDSYRFRNWRWFWDFGGGTLTDLMTHHIDIVNWYLELQYPAETVALGSNYATNGLWETPDTMQTLLSYPDQQVQAHFESTFVNARDAEMIEFMGTEATLYLDRGRYEIYPERGSAVKAEEWILGEGPRGADFYKNPDGEALHLANWLDCIRSRRPPAAPVEAGVLAAAAGHLGNIAYREKRLVRHGAAALNSGREA
ncbi:MAG: Gfo/Idh/MocA family oxidoreductase [Acidobacteria bacterium]|nr:Gfo/Idh/MocA family oxidoreductase [Acidobacteriota bacterium]MBI3279765.1 Gfo/Idh/MocA family oxidoreductase [Acidobacteriota bacterium]